MRKVIKSNHKDRIEVDVSSRHIRIERWDDEVNYGIEAIGNHRTNHYEIESSEQYPEGGYEFETILDEKPSTNVIRYKLNKKGVDFFYQPPLTEQEIADGAVRSENVIGSYAVYASEQKINRVGGKLYRTGKVGHIYRPKIKDANGAEVWGELNIQGTNLTVTIPQEFLDSAVYPVVVDPTFGYTDIGATGTFGWGDLVLGTKFAMTESATGNSMSVYVTTGNNTARCLLYQDSDKAKVAETVEFTTAAVDGAAWKTADFASAPSLTAQDYWLMGFAQDTNNSMAYDSEVGFTSGFQSSTYPTVPDPLSIGTTQTSRRYSIYVTYTAGGGSSVKTVGGLALASVKTKNGLAVASIKSWNGLE